MDRTRAIRTASALVLTTAAGITALSLAQPGTSVAQEPPAEITNGTATPAIDATQPIVVVVPADGSDPTISYGTQPATIDENAAEGYEAEGYVEDESEHEAEGYVEDEAEGYVEDESEHEDEDQSEHEDEGYVDEDETGEHVEDND